jgi:hypothetical protein
MKAAWIALTTLLVALPSAAKVLPEPTHNETESVRAEFLDTPGFMNRWRVMLALDTRHLYGLTDTDTPDLRLAVFPGDLAGNEARMVDTRQAGNPLAADRHERVVSETLRAITASGDGTREVPFTTFSEVEAMRYMALTGHIPVATALVVTQRGEPLLAVWFKDDADAQPWYFSLKSVYRRVLREYAHRSPTGRLSGWHFLIHMAERGSPAALVGRAATNLRDNNHSRTREITEWLRTAARADNALAIVLLGDMERNQEPQSPAQHRECLEKALLQYAHASQLGYVPAMQRIQEVEAELAALASPVLEVAVNTMAPSAMAPLGLLE